MNVQPAASDVHATTPVAALGSHGDRSVAYRADVDGLRAVAILVVVLYHAGVPGFGGGFVGVDVFFVISGWLITQQLLLRSASSGGAGLLGFWTRRIRRLVPASFCMIVGTALLSVLVLSPLDWRLIAARGAASALYVSNLLFAARAGDYFSGPLKDSPYLHTWSLGVEEQFYLVWPLMFAAVVLLSRWWVTRGLRFALVSMMAAIFVVSMTINVRLTDAGSPWGFFGLQARAWEFALAGVVASLLLERPNPAARASTLMAVPGLGLIAVAVLRFDDTTPFPGFAALVPVVGTLLVLVAGHDNRAARGPLVALRWRPVVILGLWSYSWYLWHWPLMTIATQALYRDTVAIRLIAAAIALAVAVLSYRFVENPIRNSVSLRRSRRLTYAVGAAFTIVAVAACGALYLYEREMIEREPYRTYEATRASFSNFGCEHERSTSGIPFCKGGDATADRTVLLVGDSHAGQWMSVFGDAGRSSGIRVVLRSTGNCSATPRSEGPSAGGSRGGCPSFQEDTRHLIDELSPEAVVLADANGTKDRTYPEGAQEWRRAVEGQIRDLHRKGIAVGLVKDAPLSNDPLLCLARGRSKDYCTIDFDSAMRPVRKYATATKDLVSRDGLVVFGVNDRICRTGRCRFKADGAWVYAAFEHLAQDFTLAQRPSVESFMEQLLAQKEAQ